MDKPKCGVITCPGLCEFDWPRVTLLMKVMSWIRNRTCMLQECQNTQPALRRRKG